MSRLQDNPEHACELYGECLALFRQVGDVAGIAWTLNYQGDVARESNDLTAARSFYEQSLAAFSLSRDGWGIASALSDLASLSWDQVTMTRLVACMARASRCFRIWVISVVSQECWSV